MNLDIWSQTVKVLTSPRWTGARTLFIFCAFHSYPWKHNMTMLKSQPASDKPGPGVSCTEPRHQTLLGWGPVSASASSSLSSSFSSLSSSSASVSVSVLASVSASASPENRTKKFFFPCSITYCVNKLHCQSCLPSADRPNQFKVFLIPLWTVSVTFVTQCLALVCPPNPDNEELIENIL